MFADRGGWRHHDGEVRVFRLHDPRCLDQGWCDALDLTGATAWQNEQQFVLAAHPDLRPQRCAIPQFRPAQCRIAHNRHRQIIWRVIGRFHMVDADQMIDRRGKRLGATCARCPDLWSDQFDQFDARISIANPLRHAQHESPGIDQYDGVRLGRNDCIGSRICKLYHRAIGFQPFKQSENGERCNIDGRRNANLGKLVAANPVNVNVWRHSA